MGKGEISASKMSFLNNAGLFLSAREKILNKFKRIIFLIRNLDEIPTNEPAPELALEPTKEQNNKSSFKMIN